MLRTFISTLLFSGMLFSQTEAYDALKVMEPLIGEWFSKHKSQGVFEGEPKNTQIISNYTYEWVADKTAILETWKSTSEKTNKRVHVGSIVYTLDPATNTIKTKHFGYDGKVYWTSPIDFTIVTKMLCFDSVCCGIESIYYTSNMDPFIGFF